MGHKVPWEIGILICHPVTSRSLIFLQKGAVSSTCNFATTHLTACILNFHLPLTSRPMKWRTLPRRPIRDFRDSRDFSGEKTPFVMTPFSVPDRKFIIWRPPEHWTEIAKKVLTTLEGGEGGSFPQERPFVHSSVCSQFLEGLFAFWLSARNSVWGPINRKSRGNPSLCWLGRGG